MGIIVRLGEKIYCKIGGESIPRTLMRHAMRLFRMSTVYMCIRSSKFVFVDVAQ